MTHLVAWSLAIREYSCDHRMAVTSGGRIGPILLCAYGKMRIGVKLVNARVQQSQIVSGEPRLRVAAPEGINLTDGRWRHRQSKTYHSGMNMIVSHWLPPCAVVSSFKNLRPPAEAEQSRATQKDFLADRCACALCAIEGFFLKFVCSRIASEFSGAGYRSRRRNIRYPNKMMMAPTTAPIKPAF